MDEKERTWITFAAAALNGILANSNSTAWSNDEITEYAAERADKMMIELKAREANSVQRKRG